MRTAGINYDTGFVLGENSRPDFDAAAVEREMHVIADDLHCNAVRVSGSDPARLEVAARAAVRARPPGLGLTVRHRPAGGGDGRDRPGLRRLGRAGPAGRR